MFVRLFVVGCWVLLFLVFFVRKRWPDPVREVRTNPMWKLGLPVQMLGLAATLALRRPAGTPLAGAAEPVLAALALALAAGSTWVMLAAKRALGEKHFAYQARLVEGHKLIQHGPYRVVRNPMYTAAIGLTAAMALAFSRWEGLVAAIALSWTGSMIRVRAEEKLLREAFGAEFEDYARRVPALIPRAVRSGSGAGPRPAPGRPTRG